MMQGQNVQAVEGAVAKVVACDEARWAVRATAWELAAFCFRYPDAELAAAVASGEWAEAAIELAGALGLALPGDFDGEPVAGGEAGSSGAACADGSDERASDDLLHVLRAEATRLFVGAPSPACSPYEGVWRAEDDGVAPLLFVNPRSMEVERFARSCGLGRPEGTNEPLDHVSAECELLEHLALRAAGAASSEGSPADGALPGGSASAAYALFLEEHARAWMPRFAKAVAACSRQPFYRGAAAYLGALVRA